MNRKPSPKNPWGVSHAAQVTYYPTGEVHGVGSSGVNVHATVALEGNTRGVEANLDRCWTSLDFDLPTKLPLGSEKWIIPFDDTELKVRLLPKERGEELWSSLNTTTLPEFTRVSIRAVPAFMPAKTQDVAEIVLENIELLLMAIDRPKLPYSARHSLSLRANFYERPGRDKLLLKATVPLTGEIRYESPSPVPVTTEVRDRLVRLRTELISSIGDQTLAAGGFVAKIRRIIHDFSFFSRQHSGSLSKLTEPLIRDLLLVVFKHFFPAEGEAFHQAGKSDIKVTNLHNRYEFAVVELKVWRGEASIKELLRQAFNDHVTGQEALVVCQVLSQNADFAAVVDQVRDLIENDARIVGYLSRTSFEGSREILYDGRVRIVDNEIPILVSCVNLHNQSGSS